MLPHIPPISVYIRFLNVSIYTHYILTSHLNLSASQPIISFSMRFDIVSSLLAWQDEKSSWASAPVVNHGGTYVSLSDGVGENAKSPDGVPNPPLFHPTHSKYQFDPGQFKGIGDYPALCQMLKDACPGCTLYEQRKDTEKHRYQLRCNRYPKEHKDNNTFSPQCFTKDNVPPVTNKRSTSYSQAAFSRRKIIK